METLKAEEGAKVEEEVVPPVPPTPPETNSAPLETDDQKPKSPREAGQTSKGSEDGKEEPHRESHVYMIAMDGSAPAGRAFKWLFRQLERHSDKASIMVKIVHFLPTVSAQVAATEAYQTAKNDICSGINDFARILESLKVRLDKIGPSHSQY